MEASHRTRVGLVLVVAAAIAFRLNGGLYRDLWEDEIIAATHAMQSIWQLPIEIVRHDVHPFLYFLQLHVWCLFGTSDVWLKLNSLVWNLAAIVSIGTVGRRLYGARVGVIAAALFAVLPSCVWMAQEVRPYSWLYVLIIWNFDRVETACRTGFASWRVSLCVFALCLAIIYSHAIGFVIVFLFGVYAGIVLLRDGAPLRSYLRWFAVFAATAVCALPPLAIDLARDANLGGPETLWGLALWVPRMVLPRGDDPVAVALAAVVYLAVLAFGLGIRSTRVMTGVFLVLPLGLAAALNTRGIVIFKLNIFSTIVAPFLPLSLARLSQELRPRLREPLLWICATLFILGSVEYLANRVPTTGFLAASRMIRADARPGDIVYVPQQSMFWGMARYLVGPRWGSALAVSAPPNPAWQRVYNRLGPGLVAMLHLQPVTQTLSTPDGLVLLVGPESPDRASSGRRVWLVTYDRADLPVGFPPRALGGLKAGEPVLVGLLRVTLFQ